MLFMHLLSSFPHVVAFHAKVFLMISKICPVSKFGHIGGFLTSQIRWEIYRKGLDNYERRGLKFRIQWI